jgi:hypothetical protein
MKINSKKSFLSLREIIKVSLNTWFLPTTGWDGELRDRERHTVINTHQNWLWLDRGEDTLYNIKVERSTAVTPLVVQG